MKIIEAFWKNSSNILRTTNKCSSLHFHLLIVVGSARVYICLFTLPSRLFPRQVWMLGTFFATSLFPNCTRLSIFSYRRSRNAFLIVQIELQSQNCVAEFAKRLPTSFPFCIFSFGTITISARMRASHGTKVLKRRKKRTSRRSLKGAPKTYVVISTEITFGLPKTAA